MNPRNVAILLFDDVEVLDFAGPFEVFAVASELHDYGLFRVFTVAASAGPIHARNGLSVHPDYPLESAPTPDVLIVPGGIGTRTLMNHKDLESMLGGRNRVSEVMSRKRPLTIQMIRCLSEKMQIPAGVLLQTYKTGNQRL